MTYSQEVHDEPLTDAQLNDKWAKGFHLVSVFPEISGYWPTGGMGSIYVKYRYVFAS